MAFARGKFGIEYNTAPRREEPGPFVPIVLALVFLAALVSLVWTVYGRLKGDSVERAQAEAALEEERLLAVDAEKASAKRAEKSVSLKGISTVAPPPVPTPPAPAPRRTDAATAVASSASDSASTPLAQPAQSRERPVAVRNLQSRLKEAEAAADVEMAITTMEQLRALPGNPAPDLNEEYARKLGPLNVQRLFTMRSPLWTIDVTVGRGDSASLIASQHGSTLASLKRLNPKVDPNRLRVGQKLKVMNHPTFRFLVSRSTRTADLDLNGRFFKRYSLMGDVRGAAGTYKLPANSGPFWSSVGIILSKADRKELGDLLPKGSVIVIAER